MDRINNVINGSTDDDEDDDDDVDCFSTDEFSSGGSDIAAPTADNDGLNLGGVPQQAPPPLSLSPAYESLNGGSGSFPNDNSIQRWAQIVT